MRLNAARERTFCTYIAEIKSERFQHQMCLSRTYEIYSQRRCRRSSSQQKQINSTGRRELARPASMHPDITSREVQRAMRGRLRRGDGDLYIVDARSVLFRGRSICLTHHTRAYRQNACIRPRKHGMISLERKPMLARRRSVPTLRLRAGLMLHV